MLEATLDQPLIKKRNSEVEVKLFHPNTPGVPCEFSGKSERFKLKMTNQAMIRVLIESGEHEMFKGDRCKSCGVLAKVSVFN